MKKSSQSDLSSASQTIGLGPYPNDGATIEGCSALFQWDLRHVASREIRSRLTIKRLAIEQSVEQAMAENDAVFEVDVESQQFYLLDTTRLKPESAIYVWQILALIGNDCIAGSPIHKFSLRRYFDVREIFSSDGPSSSEAEQFVSEADLALLRSLDQCCPNGDLETGTLTGWTGYYGSRLNSPTINLNSLQQGIIPGRITLCGQTSGDPVLASPIGEGAYSVRLGNANVGGDADVISYTFTVNAQNKHFAFRYAVVMQNPYNHSAAEQPFFGYYILKGSSIFFSPSNLPIVSRWIVADSSNPFFKIAGDVVYRDWTPTCVDLSAYLGQTMTIVFYAADCSLNGHYGYGYVDGLCVSNDAVASFTMPDRICRNTVLWADGSASVNETSHFWSIQECDINGNAMPLSTELSQWFVAQIAGPINLTALNTGLGGQFKCNAFYRIKLAVNNDCTPWNETVHILLVTCPVVSAGMDTCVSCTPNGQTVQLGLGNPSTPDLIYNWIPGTGLSNPSSPSPLHTQGSVQYPFTYTVIVTDAGGCTNSSQATLYCKPPTVAIQIVEECCAVTLNAVASNYSFLQWSTGEVGALSIKPSTSGIYTLNAFNPCGGAHASVTVTSPNGPSGFFNPIAYNSKLSLSGAVYPDHLYIKDLVSGNPAGIQGAPNSYNATDYKLELFDRWGNLFRTITGSGCHGFPNWSINWDGKNNVGQPVLQDTYTFRLHFKNCQYKEWTAPKERKYKGRCTSWATFLGIQLWCRNWEYYLSDETFTTGSVTVIG